MGLRSAADGMRNLASETARFRQESERLTESLSRQADAQAQAQANMARTIAMVDAINAKLEGATLQLAETSSFIFSAVAKMAAPIDTLAGQIHQLILQDAPNAFAVLADFGTALGEGKRSLADFIDDVSKLQGMNTSGFLGDLNKLILDVTRKVNALHGGIEELQQGAGAMDWGGPGEGAGKMPAEGGDAAATGERASAGFGASGSTSTGDGNTTYFNASLRSQATNQRGLISSAIDLGPGGHTAAERARILRELQDQIRRLRR